MVSDSRILDLLARTLYELDYYPEPSEPFDELRPHLRDSYLLKATRLQSVLLANNYSFYHSPTGGRNLRHVYNT